MLQKQKNRWYAKHEFHVPSIFFIFLTYAKVIDTI